jgi:hypothetical protein
MKKIVIAVAIVAVALMLAAVLGIFLGGDGAQAVTTEPSGTTAGTTAKPLCKHIYVAGKCGICGAEEPSADEYFSFHLLEDGTYSVGAYLMTSLPERLIIPDTYEGKPVTAIKMKGFIGSKNIKYVYIPDGIKEIRAEAFYDCPNLEEVIFPESLEIIKENAFTNCDSLREITVRGDVVALRGNVFSMCDGLKKAVFECDVTDDGSSVYGLFSHCTSLETVRFNGKIIRNRGKAGFSGCFEGCKSLKNVTLPEDIDFIGGYTFFGCTGLERFDIPKSVIQITATAFSGCENLSLSATEGNDIYEVWAHRLVEKETKTLVWQNDAAPIPEDGSILKIGMYAFLKNTAITEYKIPSVITEVNSGAFKDCTSLKSVVWESAQSEIAESAFDGCGSLESVTFAIKITSIGSSAFYECTALKSIEIPETVTKIESDAFYECSALKSIKIPETVTEIEIGAFQGCTALEHVTLPQGMTALSHFIFADCTSLKTLTIPKSVKKINNYALYNCPKLNDIYYDGTKAESDKMEKVNLVGVTVIHCTDGDVQLEWKS